MSTNALATVEAAPLLPTPQAYQTMLAMAGELVKSGLMPPTVKTAAAAFAIMQKGVELRVPPMAALEGIAVVQGRPTCSAALMLALIKRDHGSGAIRVRETDDEHCTVEYREVGWEGVRRYTFTRADAERAGLLGKGIWQQYPAAMLRARCISAVARMAFPECIGGMYVPEELDAPVAVTPSGDVVYQVEPAPPTAIRAVAADDWRHGGPDPAHDSDAVLATVHMETDGDDADDDGDPEPQITPATMKALHGAGRDRGMDHEFLHQAAINRYGVTGMPMLTEREGRELLALVEREPLKAPDPAMDEIEAAVAGATPTSEPNPAQAGMVLAEVVSNWLHNIDVAKTPAALDVIEAKMPNDAQLRQAVAIKRDAFKAQRWTN